MILVLLDIANLWGASDKKERTSGGESCTTYSQTSLCQNSHDIYIDISTNFNSNGVKQPNCFSNCWKTYMYSDINSVLFKMSLRNKITNLL